MQERHDERGKSHDEHGCERPEAMLALRRNYLVALPRRCHPLRPVFTAACPYLKSLWSLGYRIIDDAVTEVRQTAVVEGMRPRQIADIQIEMVKLTSQTPSPYSQHCKKSSNSILIRVPN